MCNFTANSFSLSQTPVTLPQLHSILRWFLGIFPFLDSLHFLLLLFHAWQCEREMVLSHDWLWHVFLVALVADIQGDMGTGTLELPHCPGGPEWVNGGPVRSQWGRTPTVSLTLAGPWGIWLNFFLLSYSIPNGQHPAPPYFKAPPLRPPAVGAPSPAVVFKNYD